MAPPTLRCSLSTPPTPRRFLTTPPTVLVLGVPRAYQVSYVGQALVGEQRLAVQLSHVHQALQHRLCHQVTQHWPVLVDTAHARHVLLSIQHKLLLLWPCGRGAEVNGNIPAEGS